MSVAVLLSTYNGDLYLSEQLDSLFAQSYQNFLIYIRDDGSSDNTLDIIDRYIKLHPQRIILINDDIKNLGPAKSFMKLLTDVQADYYFFCDQDDYWKPDKVQRTLTSLHDTERNRGNIPILVHTDAELVDKKLQPLYPSLWRKMCVHPERLDNKWMIPVCCTVTGCTMAINNAAKHVSKDYPNDSGIMHDHWIAFKVSQDGIVYPLRYASLLYRQHGSNAVGIVGTGTSDRLNKLGNLSNTFAEYERWARLYRELGYGSKIKWYFFKFLFLLFR